MDRASVARPRAPSDVFQDIPEKVWSLAAKAEYEKPKVVSFPIEDRKIVDQLAFAGNF